MLLKALFLVPILVSFATASFEVYLSGTVTNKSGVELKDVIVTLEGKDVSTITNSLGRYTIRVVVPVVRPLISPINSDFSVLKNGNMVFSIQRKMPVRIDVFDLRGRLINVAVNRVLPAGSHSVRFSNAGTLGSIFLIRVRMGDRVSLYKYMTLDHSVQRISVQGRNAASSIAKLSASVDTLRASKAGYKSARIPLSALAGVVDITLDSLKNDNVGTNPFDDGSADRLKRFGVAQYFWGKLKTGVEEPLVRITHGVSNDAFDLEVTFNPHFVDNTYGSEGHVGWNPKRPHTFKDLYHSDHVQIAVVNGDGDTVFHGRLDLLSQTSLVSSGYACLGPFGGDGVIYKGDPSMIISFGSSLDDNWNYYGYRDSANSPVTDSTYKINPTYPFYQYYTIYRITFKPEVFGSSGYGEVHMTSVHASPSKDGSGTITVVEKPGPVPGSPQDPFRFLIPTGTVTPPDTIPPDTIPPDIGVD